MNEDIEEIKRHKLEQYASQTQADQQEKVSAEYDAKKRAILRQILTPDARERINVLRMTKPELVTNIESQLIVLAQSGRLQKIDDAKLKSLASPITTKEKGDTDKKDLSCEHKNYINGGIKI